MSVAMGEYGGERAVIPVMRRRLRDGDLARVRSAQMYAQRLAGWKTAEIARLFRITRQHVWREIKAIPEREKRIIEGKYRRGEISVA